MKYRILFFLFTWFIALNATNAQLSSDGSVYSRYGLGELNHFQSSQSQAMGGAGVALGMPNYLSASNPANWSNQVFTHFSANYRFQGNRLKDSAENTNTLSSGGVDNVQFGFPLKSQKVGVAFTYQPFSRVGYRVEQTGSLPASLGQTEEKYVVSYEGAGGIQQLDGGIGFALGKNVRLGASLRAYSGIIESIQRTQFEDENFIPSTNSDVTRIFGVAGNLGALYQKNFGKDNIKMFALGATITTPASLTLRKARTLGDENVVDTLGVLLNGTGTMPGLFSLGVAYRSNEKTTFVADARLDQWSKFESTLAFGGYVPASSCPVNADCTFSSFKDTWRISGGIEHLPSGRNFRAPYMQRVAYRFGFYTQPSYFTPRTDIQLNRFAITGGMSFPTRRAFNSIDLNFELGSQGTTEQKLVKDTFFKTTLSLNFADQWFQRFKIN